MTKEETKRAIEVMQAYVEGKKIEVSQLGYDDWNETTTLFWDWDKYDYRIKPEPHYRPFKSAEEVMEAIKEHGDWVIDNGIYRRIDKISCLGAEGLCITLSGLKDWGINFLPRIKDMTFADGTPFGKLEEE